MIRRGRDAGVFPPLDSRAYEHLPTLEARAGRLTRAFMAEVRRAQGQKAVRWTLKEAMIHTANEYLHNDGQTDARIAIEELRQEIADGDVDAGRDADKDLRLLLLLAATLDKLHDYHLRGRQRQLFPGSPKTAEVSVGDHYWTVVGEEIVPVEVLAITKSPRTQRTEFRVKRTDTGVHLPKARTAAALRRRPAIGQMVTPDRRQWPVAED